MDKISVSLNESSSEFAAEKAGSDVEAFVNDLVAREQKRLSAEAELGRISLVSRLAPRRFLWC